MPSNCELDNAKSAQKQMSLYVPRYRATGRFRAFRPLSERNIFQVEVCSIVMIEFICILN